jgi:hypothetical protein
MSAALVPSPVEQMSGSLTELEAARRLAERGPIARSASSRSYAGTVEAEHGRRVLAAAETPIGLQGHDPKAGPPAGLVPLGLVLCAEGLRPDARETVAFLCREGVELKRSSPTAPALNVATGRL